MPSRTLPISTTPGTGRVVRPERLAYRMRTSACAKSPLFFHFYGGYCRLTLPCPKRWWVYVYLREKGTTLLEKRQGSFALFRVQFPCCRRRQRISGSNESSPDCPRMLK